VRHLSDFPGFKTIHLERKDMRPLSLSLQGFIGIMSGQGKPSVEIDLRVIPEEAQLIAFAGINGAGKTTIIDNLHPYRVMPSHAKSPTPTSFSFYDHIVPGVDAMKDFVFSINGKEYRSTLRMRIAGKSKKQECYLFVKDDAGGWATYENPRTGLKSTGGADAYDLCVEDLCGKPEIFFSTAFSAQKKKLISAMTTSEVKSLFSSMQGNEGLKALSEKSSEVMKALKAYMLALQAQSAPLNMVAANAPSHARKIRELEQIISDRQALLQSCVIEIAAKKSVIDEMDRAVKNQAAISVQRQSLMDQYSGLVDQNKLQLAAFDASQLANKQSRSEHVQQMTLSVKNKHAYVADLKQRLTGLQRIISSASLMAARKVELQDLIAKKSDTRMKIDDHWVDVDRLSKLRAVIAQFRETLTNSKKDAEAVKAILDAAREVASLIDKVPCSGHAFSMSCPLLEQARTEQLKIPTQEARIIRIREGYKSTMDEAKASDLEYQQLEQRAQEREKLHRELQDIEDAITRVREEMKDAPLLDSAHSEIPVLQAKLHAANLELDQQISELNKLSQSHSSADAHDKLSRNDFVQILAQQENALMVQIDALPAPISSEVIGQERMHFDKLSERQQAIADSLELLNLELQSFTKELTKSEEAQRQIASLEAQASAASLEITQWMLLSKALGNDGIIAMSIDDAGPRISRITNQLLEDCYGGRFVIRISTQEATATGVLKEAFEIHVEDTTRGTSTILDFMSGGETVWINECLIRAMALFMDQSSGSRYETLFSDESDGPLDEERKRNFMSMKRAVLARGGYKREYMITHTPELRDMCDAVIDVSTL
jgi:DNA repair protein SbcC/Rad50